MLASQRWRKPWEGRQGHLTLPHCESNSVRTCCRISMCAHGMCCDQVGQNAPAMDVKREVKCHPHHQESEVEFKSIGVSRTATRTQSVPCGTSLYFDAVKHFFLPWEARSTKLRSSKSPQSWKYEAFQTSTSSRFSKPFLITILKPVAPLLCIHIRGR